MTNKTISFADDALQYAIKDSASLHLGVSAYLNQLLWCKMGSPSVFGNTDLKEKFDQQHVELKEQAKTIEANILSKKDKWLDGFVKQLKRKQIFEQDEFIRLQSGITEEMLGEELSIEFLIDYAKSKGVRL